MFNQNVLRVFETVGTFLLYEDTFAFMIGPDKTGERLVVVRLGGHIEGDESLKEALEREMKEEGDTEIEILSSPKTYFKNSWNEEGYSEIAEVLDMSLKPFAIIGDEKRSTAVFLSYAHHEPKPSAEAYGIIFLKKDDVKDICADRFNLKDFIARGGKLLQQKEIDFDMKVSSRGHLEFLTKLLEHEEELIHRFMKREL